MKVPGPLQDSTTILGDREALATRMRADGYLFFPQLLDPHRVGAVRSLILLALEGLGWLAPGSPPREALPGAEIHREGEDGWWPAYVAIQQMQTFHELAHDDRLLEVIASLVGGEVLVHPRKIARITYPGSASPTPAHQDFPLIQGAADTFTAWVPLGDCPAPMGALRVLRGSHQRGLRKVGIKEGVGGLGVDAADDDPDWVSTDYRLGDALFFHSFTVHWAPANEDRRLRLSSDFRYQNAADPVVEGSLHPHQWPVVPDWSELTAGWSSTACVDAPPGVRVAPFQPPLDDLGRPSSRVLRPASS